MSRADVEHVVRYWSQASPADLERMAVDPAKIPAPHIFEEQLHRMLAIHDGAPKSFYLVWWADGRAVGYSSLKNIHVGEDAEMHLHMWDAGLRGQGHGARLFCMSALEFYARFRLKTIRCEPGQRNPMPNAMLRRVGFPLIGTRVGASSDLSAVTELNTYEIGRETAQAYLARVAPHATDA